MRPLSAFLLLGTIAFPLEAQRSKDGPLLGAPRPATPTPAPTRPARPTRDTHGYYRHERLRATHFQEPFARVHPTEVRCPDATAQHVVLALAHASPTHRAWLVGHSGPAAEIPVEYLFEVHSQFGQGTSPFPTSSRLIVAFDGIPNELPVVRSCVVSHVSLGDTPNCGALTPSQVREFTTARAIGLRVVANGQTCVGTLAPEAVAQLRRDVDREYYQHTVVRP